MTYTKRTTLWCDSETCNEHRTFETNRVARARSLARDNGWSCREHGDFCAGCSE